MANVSFTAPTDWSTEQGEIDRRRAYAQALQQQSMEPLQTNQMAGGWVVPTSPWQGLAKLGQAYFGAKGQKAATEQQKALAATLRDRRSKEWNSALEAGRAAPEQWAGDLSVPGDERYTPARAANPMATFQALSKSDFPDYRAAGLANVLKEEKPSSIGSGGLRLRDGTIIPPQARPETPQSIGAGGLRLPDGTIVPPVEKPVKDEGAWGEPYQMGGAWVQKNDITGQVRQSVNREPIIRVNNPAPVTAVTIQDPNDPNGTVIIDGRSRQVLGKGPKLTDVGKMEQKRAFNMQGIGSVIQSAEDLLGGSAGRPLPTGSGLGTAVDFAGSLVGMSPKGSKEADSLRSVGAALVAKMPRMEGPQSDKDVALYKESAGRIGDSTIPVDRRKAALETVKGLWSKYERLNPDAFADRRAPAAPAGPSVDDLLKKYGG